MGIMTELYLAPVDAVGAAALPPGEDGVPLGGLTELEFSTLWAAAEGVDWDADRHELDTLDDGDPEGPWVCRFPAAFVDLLAGLDDERAAQVLENWAASEEIAADPADLAHIVHDVRELARKATGTGRTIYLWFSL